MAKVPDLETDPILLARAREGGFIDPLPPISAPRRNEAAEEAQFLARSLRHLRLLDGELAEINARKSAIYKELRNAGYDIHAVRQTAKQMKWTPALREARRRLIEAYWADIEALVIKEIDA